MFEKPTWLRLLIDTSRSGEMNMAVDEMLGREVRGRGDKMILRFYGWSPPAVSIGYAQSFRELNLKALEDDGLGWVRRITGGGAVLHRGEITYSLALPYHRGDGIRRSDLFSFCAGILSGCFNSLGITTEVKRPPTSRPGPDCFAAPGAYELVEKSSGRKIAGSASTTKKGFFLQHGSLPLDATHREISRYLTVSGPPDVDFAGSISIGELADLDRAEILEAFRCYLERKFKVLPFSLSEEMLKAARKIAEERYAAPAWLFRC